MTSPLSPEALERLNTFLSQRDLGIGNDKEIIARHNDHLLRASDLRALIAEVERYRPRPISEAPKDGTNILGIGKKKTGEIYWQVFSFYGNRWTIEWMDGFEPPTMFIPLDVFALPSVDGGGV